MKTQNVGLFDIDEYGIDIESPVKLEQPKVSKPYVLAKKQSKALLKKENAIEILNQIGDLKQGESVDVLTNGQSNAGGFYEAYMEKYGYIDCLCVATWIINRQYIDLLCEHLETKKLVELIFIISNRMKELGKGHAPNFNRMKQKFMDLNVPFRVVNSHAKTYSFKAGNNYITIDGSGNWSDNPRIENYTISNDESKFMFRKQWMTELVKAD